MNPALDFFFDKPQKWQKEIEALRKIVLSCGINEGLKWGGPYYTYKGNQIVLIHTFKAYCAVLFFKGTLLKDSDKILMQQTADVQFARQMRFTSLDEVKALEKTLIAYIAEAVEIEKEGKEVKSKKSQDFYVHEEFKAILAENPKLKTAFDALTPSRQRGYLLHFAVPKQVKTRIARIEKCVPLILKGKGVND